MQGLCICRVQYVLSPYSVIYLCVIDLMFGDEIPLFVPVSPIVWSVKSHHSSTCLYNKWLVMDF